MATIEVRHSCGHVARADVKDDLTPEQRACRERWLSRRVCPACAEARATDEARRAAWAHGMDAFGPGQGRAERLRGRVLAAYDERDVRTVGVLQTVASRVKGADGRCASEYTRWSRMRALTLDVLRRHDAAWWGARAGMAPDDLLAGAMRTACGLMRADDAMAEEDAARTPVTMVA